MTECPKISAKPECAPTNQIAILALGSFWTPQVEFQNMKGVARAVVGYTGGKEENPSFRQIKDATEAVLIEYDPKVISYFQLLDEWADMHHPFLKRENQHRSAIFPLNDIQNFAAETKLGELRESFPDERLQSSIEPAGAFYRAEEYHQDYVNKNWCCRGPLSFFH